MSTTRTAAQGHDDRKAGSKLVWCLCVRVDRRAMCPSNSDASRQSRRVNHGWERPDEYHASRPLVRGQQQKVPGMSTPRSAKFCAAEPSWCHSSCIPSWRCFSWPVHLRLTVIQGSHGETICIERTPSRSSKRMGVERGIVCAINTDLLPTQQS